jgi:hypothetical protein
MLCRTKKCLLILIIFFCTFANADDHDAALEVVDVADLLGLDNFLPFTNNVEITNNSTTKDDTTADETTEITESLQEPSGQLSLYSYMSMSAVCLPNVSCLFTYVSCLLTYNQLIIYQMSCLCIKCQLFVYIKSAVCLPRLAVC